jgi:transcriptional antiterminator NusG
LGDGMAKQWYVIHTMSGFEEKVKSSIQERAKTKGLEDKISRILIPTEKIIEVKGKKRKNQKRSFILVIF